MTRKMKGLAFVLAILLCLTLGTTGALADTSLGDMTGQLVIIHTNDVHGRLYENMGYAGLAARAAEYEAAGADVLILDAGDTLHGTATAVALKGSAVVDVLNKVGTVAMVPGNHDFNYGYDRLLELEELMDFDLLAANVFYEETGELLFDDNVVIEVGGYKVGIFGLATVETVTKTNPNNVKGIKFAEGKELYDIAQKQVNALKAENCDLIICLGHLGVDGGSEPNRSTDVIKNVKGIDLFVDGHSHTEFPNGQKEGDTLLASTGEYMENLGEVVYDGKTLTAKLTSAEDYTVRDKDIADLVQSYVDEMNKIYDVVIGSSTVTLNGEREVNRAQESNLGDLATDAIMYAAKQANYDVDVALTNGGGIRQSVAAGNITKKNMLDVFPFGNQVVIFDITGAALLEALEANTEALPSLEGGFPQVAGMTYFVQLDKTEDRVTIVQIGGKPFDPKATYTLATNDFIGAGGDKYSVFGDFYSGQMSGINLEDAMIDYIQDELGGVVGARYAEPQGRITVGDQWYLDAVIYTMTEGIMKGVDEYNFAPALTVNRATVAQTFYNMAGQPDVSLEDNFSDIPAGDWYEKAAAWSKSVGLFEGTGDNRFEGGRAITRAEMVKVFYSYMVLEEVDVKEGDLTAFIDSEDVPEWAEEAMSYAVGTGVVGGRASADGDKLEPFGVSMRAELAQLFLNLSQVA